jgi:hypothetical protein
MELHDSVRIDFTLVTGCISRHLASVNVGGKRFRATTKASKDGRPSIIAHWIRPGDVAVVGARLLDKLDDTRVDMRGQAWSCTVVCVPVCLPPDDKSEGKHYAVGFGLNSDRLQIFFKSLCIFSGLVRLKFGKSVSSPRGFLAINLRK